LDAPSGGSVVNEVQHRYNGFGQLTQEYQDHFGPVNSSITPKVTYSYSEASGGNHSRLTTMTYPNGRTVEYEYDPGVDTAISRLSRLTGDAVGGGLTSYEEYDYLGASTMVERGRPESGIKLTMVSQTGSVGDAGDPYTGLDRFGRVVDQRWIEGSGGSATDVDRYTYQFDRNSSRTARINQLDAAFSETYAFDGVDRLVDFARGGGGSGPQAQQWNLDALGNWTTITSDGTPESRTHNSQNELTGVGATPLAYDANGNMIQDEAGRQLQYNAWNRLVRVSLSGDQVAAYQYNGFQQRIVTTVGNGPSAIARDLFYSAGWQVLEQRIRAGGSLGNVAEEQFVWSVAYIDGLILRDRNADLNNATGNGGLEERVYALQDALWNTTALVDVNGNVLDRFAYTPYGVVETLNVNWTPTASPSIPWAVLFRGYFADEGTGLLHARNRQYSPTLGRFIGRDEIGYLGGGLGLYAAYYIPNALDPLGLRKTTRIVNFTFQIGDSAPQWEYSHWLGDEVLDTKVYDYTNEQWNEYLCCCEEKKYHDIYELRQPSWEYIEYVVNQSLKAKVKITAEDDLITQLSHGIDGSLLGLTPQGHAVGAVLGILSAWIGTHDISVEVLATEVVNGAKRYTGNKEPRYGKAFWSLAHGLMTYIGCNGKSRADCGKGNSTPHPDGG
jgi:RHS repeat-associated protein